MNKQNSISDSPQEKPSIPSGNSQFSGDNSSPAVAPAHHADDQYRLLFDSAADGILLVNVVTGQIVRANPAAEIIFGYSSDELRNKYFWELSPKKFQTTNRQFLRNFRDDHTCHFEDLPLVTKTGKPVQVEIVGSLFQMHDQQIAHFNIRDISERKTAEKAREVIYKISQAAVSTGSLDELYASIHAILGELLPMENFYIALYDPSSDTLSFPFFIDEYEKSAPPIKLGRGLTGYVIRTGRSLLITQELFDQLVKEGELELIGAKSVDWLGVPLMVKGQIIGAMATQSYNERTHYSQDDADLMQFVSTQVALAIERKHSEEALSKSEAELRALFSAMTDVILVLDSNGRYLKIAPTNPNLLYKTPDKMLGKTLHEVLPKEQADRFLKEIHASLANKKTRQFEYALSIAERTSWFSCSISPMSEDAIVWVARDITERKLAEETLRKSETRYRNLFEDSPISLWEEDFSAVRQYLDGLRRNGVNDFKEYFESHPEEINRCVSMIKVLDVNKAAVKMAHAPDKSRLIGSMDQLFGSKIPVDFIQELVSVAEGKTEFDWEGVNYRLDGEQLVVSMRWSAAPGYEETLSKVLLSFTDITEQVHVQETLRSLSLTDDLTGLYNRRGFTLLAEQQMRLAHRVNIKILMFYGDVNDLKLINDTFGHTEGDQALIDTAAVLRSTFREADIIARIGGDEFVVLALDSSGDSCELLEERFHQALQDFNQCGNHLFNISVSFSGVSYDPETPISLNDLIKLADQKMYVQKQTWHRLNKTSRGGPSRSLWHHK